MGFACESSSIAALEIECETAGLFLFFFFKSALVLKGNRQNRVFFRRGGGVEFFVPLRWIVSDLLYAPFKNA